MRNRNPFSIFLMIFAVTFMLDLFSGYGGLFVIAGVTVYLMYRAASSSKNNTNRQQTYTRSNTQRDTRRYGYGDTSHSSDQKARINVYLSKRFRNGETEVKLYVDGKDVVITRPENARYISLDSLSVRYDGRRYQSMQTFRRANASAYDRVFDALLQMARTDAAYEGPKIVDAEIVEPETVQKSTKAQEAPKANNTSNQKKVMNAETFREEVNELNDAIPNEEISNSLYQTTNLLKQLADLEERFPDQKPKLNKLYETYLPYLIGILKQYTKMQGVTSDPNYKENEENLRKTINHINSAMQDRLIPSMSESDSINLSADMSTLEAMLRKDGMTSDDDITMAMKKNQ